jgi:hypothetical protein
MSNGELVRQTLAGRTEAFAELVRRWAGRVTALCHAKVRRADVADDLAGQTLEPAADKPGPAPRASHLLDWIRDLKATAESRLVPDSKYAGGALIAVDPYGQQAKLSLRRFHVDVYIEDGFARTTIDQTYFNHAPWRLEGTFYFPLSPDASLSRLAMYVADETGTCNLMEGGMAEREHARTVYERILYQQKDPALLEWVDGSTFKMRVFPLEGRQEKRIILSYTQKLPSLYGRTTYRFPASHSLELIRDWRFHAVVKNGAGLAASCPSHPKMNVQKDDRDLVLHHHADLVKADRDVVFDLVDGQDALRARDEARFALAHHEGYRYLMLRYRPELPGKAERQRRDWVFLFETSADRDPLLARVQIEVIRALLANAEHDDTFVILAANARVHQSSAQPQAATPENVKAAMAFLEKVHLVGALDLRGALAAAEPFLKQGKNPHLVHVGSGIAALGERREDVLARRVPDGVRYVGVGVGKRWSRQLMKAAAERTGGYFTQINPDEPVAWRSFELLATLNTPRLLDVTVADKADKATFLTYANSVAQGEEVCAVTRIGPNDDMPQTLTVAGLLDGKPFRREVRVGGIAGGADYLPRTWAKLEIDRLLAENAEHHKKTITELSLAMYVMTPFTSLLVLENEQMYKDFKVDRGRKDHWAMYPCPVKVPVVYEPDPTRPDDAPNAPKRGADQKPPAHQVQHTILIRVPPRCLNWPYRANGDPGKTVTAYQVYRGAYAVPERPSFLPLSDTGKDLKDLAGELPIEFTGGTDLGYYPPAGAVVVKAGTRIQSRTESLGGEEWYLGARLEMPVAAGQKGRAEFGLRVDGKIPYMTWLFKNTEGLPYSSVDFEAAEKLSYQLTPDGRKMLEEDEPGGQPWGERPVPEESEFRRRLGEGERLVRKQQIVLGVTARVLGTSEEVAARDGFGILTGKPAKINLNTFSDVELLDGLGKDLKISAAFRYGLAAPSGVLGRPPLYARPSFRDDPRVFTDLAAYAPGLNTQAADIAAVLEAEAAPSMGSLPGSIDPAARRLIDRARSLGWQTLTLADKDGKPRFALTFDGRGHYRYEQTLSLGLRELVVCDGQTLLHLYPEIGIGARRTVARPHRAALSGLVPWVLPPAEDLARGVHLHALDERTVAVVPAETRGDDGKPAPYLCIHLLFADEGRLTERRLIEMPAGEGAAVGKGKVHLREVYEPSGVVRLLDKDGKELAVRKGALSAAAAPELSPDTSKLVVLPLPLRSREHVYRKFGFNPNHDLDYGENACYQYLEPAEALELFATEFASQQGPRARQVFRACFEEHGVRLPGFYVLLAASGIDVSFEPGLVAMLKEQPRDPLLGYLTLCGNAYYARWQRRWAVYAGDKLGPPDSFLGRLAAYRDLTLRWTDLSVDSYRLAERQAEIERTLGFIRGNRSNAFSLALLDLLSYRMGSKPVFLALADAWTPFEEVSGLRYTSRYEQARNLAHAGRRDEARQRFNDLYTEAVKAGVLPPIDSSLRNTLLSSGKDADLWDGLMRRTAAALIEQKARPAVIALAWYCWQLEDYPLAQNLYALAFDGITGDGERLLTSLAAVDYLRQTNQLDEAQRLVESLLNHEKFAQWAGLWRLGRDVAASRGKTARATECLERALDLEYRHLPDVINLETVRRDYGTLLEHYLSLAQALTPLKTEAPRDLKARTIQATDRWRALDRDNPDASRPAAQILKLLGEDNLAWDYLTTPIALKPRESDPWWSLAETLSREGNLALADRAFASAFEAEPTNPQILWDRAQNLRRAGREPEARQLLRQIADTVWQPRFNGIHAQARWQLGER